MTLEKLRRVLAGLTPEDAPYGAGLWEIYREGSTYICMDCGPNDDGTTVYTFTVFSDKNPDDIHDVAGEYVFRNGVVTGIDALTGPEEELLKAWEQAEAA